MKKTKSHLCTWNIYGLFYMGSTYIRQDTWRICGKNLEEAVIESIKQRWPISHEDFEIDFNTNFPVDFVVKDITSDWFFEAHVKSL